jgi:dephospho-CoA kinase
MRLIGLTGNIASGKSTVARLLAEQGAIIVDADLLSREAVRPGTPALRAIAERWGTEVLAPDGTLDRAALRQIVFAERGELDALNAIVHPEVERMREQRIEAARAGGATLVVCDIPLLFERHLADRFDAIVLVDAPRPVRLERLVRDRGLHEAEAMDMIAAQMPAELKRARSDFVIDNTGTPEALRERVGEVWNALLRGERRAGGAATVAPTPPRRTGHAHAAGAALLDPATRHG